MSQQQRSYISLRSFLILISTPPFVWFILWAVGVIARFFQLNGHVPMPEFLGGWQPSPQPVEPPK